MHEVKTQWLDVDGRQRLPGLRRHPGHAATTAASPSPTTSPTPTAAARRATRWTADHDGTLVGTAGHLHPGGLWTDLKVTRAGRTVEVFRSRAHYYEPAGAVSWDVSMTATPPNWRVAIKKGDVLSVSGTYDSRTTSWYESMAIMPLAMTVAPAGGADPFTHQHGGQGRAHPRPPARERPPRRGARHAARRHQAPRRPALADGRHRGLRLRAGRPVRPPGPSGRPPVVSPGQPLTFVNDDAAQNVFHTITACRAPCTATTGIAFPLANGPAVFDSGELGFGPAGFTPAANRKEWQTPTDPDRRDVHLLLPHPPVHARRLPREGVVRCACSSSSSSPTRRPGWWGSGPRPGARRSTCCTRPMVAAWPDPRGLERRRRPRLRPLGARLEGPVDRRPGRASCARRTTPACPCWASASAARRSRPPSAPP